MTCSCLDIYWIIFIFYLFDWLAMWWLEWKATHICMFHAYMKSFTINVVGVLRVSLFLDSSSPIWAVGYLCCMEKIQIKIKINFELGSRERCIKVMSTGCTPISCHQMRLVNWSHCFPDSSILREQYYCQPSKSSPQTW